MKGSPLHNPQFKCSNCIHFPGAHVACIEERLVQTVAALLQYFISCLPTQFPEDDEYLTTKGKWSKGNEYQAHASIAEQMSATEHGQKTC
ncbi:hypothetical protein H5410_050038 [Solanum commersonii]|uniref:Uncharacterized protein n=1 Tax=Solanum commersonii TaxID=4109 RepID=A0A9J5WU78_SOLCO|nr:hypothetical protein H5410_050038 [Solanum commersonii]